MEVIIHLPRSKEGQEELAKRVATVHAQLIYNYILKVGMFNRANGRPFSMRFRRTSTMK